MRIWETTKLERLLKLVEAGEPIPPDLLEKCKAAVKREIEIQVKRSNRSREQLDRYWRGGL